MRLKLKVHVMGFFFWDFSNYCNTITKSTKVFIPGANRVIDSLFGWMNEMFLKTCFSGPSAELVQILSRDHHLSYTPELYASYINILLGVFFSVCRDLRELRHLVMP